MYMMIENDVIRISWYKLLLRIVFVSIFSCIKRKNISELPALGTKMLNVIY